MDSYDNTPRQRIGYNDALRKTFRDERVAFTAEQVKAETARCLGCGASIVDPNKCIGCGVCTTSAPLTPSTCTGSGRSAAPCTPARTR